MVFFGTRASRIKDGRISNVTCPSCETQSSMTYAVFGKYAHIYWIPTFPVGKETVLECNHCKKTYALNELPEQIQNKFNLEKQGAGFPIWFFSGLAIIASIIAIVFFISKQDDASDIEYIKSPIIGDIYSVDNGESSYSSMKVYEVTPDSVFVILNDYEIDKKSAIHEIDKDEYYTTEKYSFASEDILIMFNEETIFEVDRD